MNSRLPVLHICLLILMVTCLVVIKIEDFHFSLPDKNPITRVEETGNYFEEQQNPDEKFKRIDSIPRTLLTEHTRRLAHLREMCENPNTFSNVTYEDPIAGTYLFSDEYNFAYCKVPKAGCTFWTQLFAILRSGASASASIFSIARSRVHGSLTKGAHSRFGRIRRGEARAILISRDPYSRLYSAFIDKAYLPNMWSLAKNVVSFEAKENNQEDLECGNNATFTGFLKLIVSNVYAGRSLNDHWKPISAICKPCQVNAFILVKQESFSTDVEFSMKQLEIEEDKLKSIEEGLHSHRIEATIPGIVQTVMGRARSSKLEHCLSVINVAERVWISFQIQGFIRDDAKFPKQLIDTAEKAKNHTYLSRVIIDTINKHPLTSGESKAQRFRHLVNAYKSVPYSVIKDIQDVYRQDFLLFDYDPEPPR